MAIKEYDVKFEGMKVHCYEGGKGYPILLMHGSGPGASSVGNWAKVLGTLARRYHVLALDLIGFGLSGRKPGEPYFDNELWTRQGQFMLNRLAKKGPVGLIGHSLSGYLVLRLAANNARVDKVLVTGSLGAKSKLNGVLRRGWTFPESEKAFLNFYRSAVADPSVITKEFVKNRMEVLNQGDYGAYFTKMFKGEKQRYLDKSVLTKAELKRIKCEVLILHGAQDRAVPFKQAAVPLADAIPQADLIRLAACGHGPALDQSGKFVDVARGLFG